MTRILALDTSTNACSVAINDNGRIRENFVVAPQDHTQRLLPMVDELLAEHQLQLAELDAIAFTQGPGSFTGLRIAVGIVQGLAFGADLPVVGVSTLEVMVATAQRLLSLAPHTVVMPALDARMNEIYWASYRCVAKNRPENMLPDAVSSPAGLLADARLKEGTNLIIGSGAALFNNPNPSELGIRSEADFHPHAFDLAHLADILFREGFSCSALEARPAYIRNEVSWAKRQRIRS